MPNMFPGKPEEAFARLMEWSDSFLGGPVNDLGRPTGPPEPAFGRSLIGCAAGDDSYWLKLSREIIPGHFTPLEAFQMAYPQEQAEATELSVVCWILPQTEATLIDQRAARDWPCERWVRSRYHGQSQVIDGLNNYILERLHDCGVQALAPDNLPQWSAFRKASPLCSPWSHRHAAFAAGLGTFGLSDGLITPVGKAMRTLSLVLRRKLPIKARTYTETYEYCLFYRKGTCGACVKRCPIGAISKEKGHDKAKCSAFLDNEITTYVAESWPDIAGAYGCGLCQSAIPCERNIPGRGK